MHNIIGVPWTQAWTAPAVGSEIGIGDHVDGKYADAAKRSRMTKA
jgi:hypothetical protein